jgi:hypothetical protein
MKIKAHNIAVLLALTSTFISAQSGGDLIISQTSINSGGGASSGGIFELSESIGQKEASPEILGGNFTLSGGFWTKHLWVVVYLSSQQGEIINIRYLIMNGLSLFTLGLRYQHLI